MIEMKLLPQIFTFFKFCVSQIVRFQDKESHQIFLEPEGRTVPELYVQV
jgi:tRNA U34 5-carboxymethylaminomethyl modifying enzyme MnmG/GidA